MILPRLRLFDLWRSLSGPPVCAWIDYCRKLRDLASLFDPGQTIF